MKQIGLIILAMLLAAPAYASAPATVEISNDAFHPAQLTIAAGQTVTFTNRDDDAHTVTSNTGAFDSKGIDTGQIWRYTFTKPGSYAYFCALHPFMKATIVVKAAQP
ncbi:MAG TPA: cupredoxin family copper-binding protein [Candidatus Baltobacteraceae bacterium]|jgi:plastocyanin|nr:cupredoxin family copper-binding protein [Candidatus Baltobacteraceae bacterium]